MRSFMTPHHLSGFWRIRILIVQKIALSPSMHLSWVVRFSGERTLTLGTPGLHDESPLGFDHLVVDSSEV